MIIVDAHQDLSWNMKTFGRDYTLSARETRRRERGSEVPLRNGDTLLGWPDFQRGGVALIFSTLFAAPRRAQVGPWDSQVYDDVNQANRLYRSQLDAYHRLVDQHPDNFQLVGSKKDMHQVLYAWEDASFTDQTTGTPSSEEEQPEAGKKEDRPWPPERNDKGSVGFDAEEEDPALRRGYPVGLVPLMEGAEGVMGIEELPEWWERGLRMIGPAWTGTRFCGGTRQPGPLTSEGVALLEGMAEIGFALDISHMDEQAALQALDIYPGVILASHSNALRLLKGTESNRHLSDVVIRRLLERDAVIGVVPFNKFLIPSWTISDGRDKVSIDRVVAHIDTICQMAGDSSHVGIGSDFDGGSGWQSAPAEINTIADLRKLIPLLSERGYSEKDVAMILGQNWITLLERFLPED